MQRTRTTPATFSADFMGMENRAITYYGPSNVIALRRELLECVRFVLREERPELTLLGGNIYREMVRAGEITLAEAVAHIVEFVEAEAETNRWTENDPDIAQAYAVLQDFENTRDVKAHSAEYQELLGCLFSAQRRLSARLLRQDGENALADMYEDHRTVLQLIIDSSHRSRGAIDRDHFESGDTTEIRLYSKMDGRKVHF